MSHGIRIVAEDSFVLSQCTGLTLRGGCNYSSKTVLRTSSRAVKWKTQSRVAYCWTAVGSLRGYKNLIEPHPQNSQPQIPLRNGVRLYKLVDGVGVNMRRVYSRRVCVLEENRFTCTYSRANRGQWFAEWRPVAVPCRERTADRNVRALLRPIGAATQSPGGKISLLGMVVSGRPVIALSHSVSRGREEIRAWVCSEWVNESMSDACNGLITWNLTLFILGFSRAEGKRVTACTYISGESEESIVIIKCFNKNQLTNCRWT